MRLSILGLWLLALPAFAAGPVVLRNDREGASYYRQQSDKRALTRVIKQVDPFQIKATFEEILREVEENKLCAYDLNASLSTRLKSINPQFTEMKGAILYLRSQNELDDISTKILLEANQTEGTKIVLPKLQEDLQLPWDETQIPLVIDLIGNFESRYLKAACFDDAYRSLYNDLKKNIKDLKSSQLEGLLVEAFKQKKLSYSLYLKLEKARVNKVEQSALSLKGYYKKIKSLRTQYPLRDSSERSDFVSQKMDKMKISRRQRLMEGYSDLQIMLMANVIKKLRVRLESNKSEILIYLPQDEMETIILGPMERFSLAIKLLRKEMALLALNTYFAGRAPDYMDLMTSAYETGLIPASELDEIAGLQEIWNPKKNFWDKATVWVRTLSSVATIAIPPPFGFIPALALVVIEMTAGKKDDKTEDPTVLF